MKRSKAYFINGGAGRVIASIPAFEKLAEETDDFIIVCEGGMDFYKGHPILHSKAYDNWHKGLFAEHIINRDIISPEPYRIWEYYNQKCSLSQAFDIAISNQGIRDLPPPKIILNKYEVTEAYKVVKEVKETTGFDKLLVIQPFGRGVVNNEEFVIDSSSRSMHLNNVVDIINNLKKDYAIIVMSEFPITLDKNDVNKYPVAMPQIPDLRIWAGIIDMCDHFIGCDSVGQHIARSFNKDATIILGSTFPINISYPNFEKFNIIDLGKDKRIYSPIRISLEDHIERLNDELMEMDAILLDKVVSDIRKKLGNSITHKNKVLPMPMQPAIEEQKKFSISNGSLTPPKK